jgi:predicted Zn-dependent protease
MSRRSAWGRTVLAGLLGAAAWVSALAVTAGPTRAQSLIFDDEIEGLLTDYARPVLKAAGLTQGNIAMRIINDPTFNAFVLDGRNVFVHTGVVMQSDKPNQVIGVIAHEVGHIDGAHLAALRSEMQRMQTGMMITRIIGIAAAVLARSGAAVVAGDDPWIKTFLARRRQQESAADQAGVRFLSMTRQSGRGMLETFETLGRENRAYGVNPYLLSHPTETTRIAQLRDAVQRSPYYNVKDPPALQLRHDLVRAKLRGFTMPAQDVTRIYGSDGSLPARYARAIAANCSGSCARAVGQIDALIKDSPKNPFFWELKAHVYGREGRHQLAIPALRQALQLTNNRSHLMRMELAKLIVDSNDRNQLPEAIRILEVSMDTRPDDIGGHQVLARAYAGLGRIADADVAMAQAHLARGDNKQAIIFAKRAQRQLKVGSRAWLKADDILKTLPQERRW